jgi:hypothetical protein
VIVTMILVKDVQADKSAQQRITTRQDVAEEYAEHLKAGCEFPPIVVFKDKLGHYWLASGFHRLLAHKLAKRKYIACDVREGELRDAILFSVGCNRQHGLRREPADKRRAVLTLLIDEEWGQWAGREIAKQCGVSEGLVRILKKELSAHKTQIPQPVKVTRGGTSYTMMPHPTRKRIDEMTAKEQADALNEAELVALRPRAIASATKHLDEAAEDVRPYEDLGDVLGHIEQAQGLLAVMTANG